MKTYKFFYSILFSILLSSGNAQQDQLTCCGEIYRKLNFTRPIPDGDTCRYIFGKFESDLKTTRTIAPQQGPLTPRDLQTKMTNTPNSISAPNQGDAAPTLYPFALGGGSVGGTGSEAGTNALTTLSLNPAIFFADMDDTDESAKWGRIMDMSVILPLNEIQSGASDRLSYFGLRARVNTNGGLKGGKLEQDVKQAFRDLLNNAAIEREQIRNLILSSSDCVKCAEQLYEFCLGQVESSSVKKACGDNLKTEEGDVIYSTFKETLDALLEEVDKKYFGLDMRGDFGDPTLGAVDSARGTSLYAGIGWGKSIKGDEDASKNFRLSLGFRYKDLESVEANAFDLDGAAGFDFTWPYQFQQVKLGLGVEFRTNLEKKGENIMDTDLTEAFETNYLYFRTSLNIPITQSNSLSFQYGTSIAGKKSSVLSLNFNWKLLLEDD